MSQLPHATHTPGSRPVGGAHACLPADRLTGPERALFRILPTDYARGSHEPDSDPPSHTPPRQAAPRTTQLESVPVSGLKSRPPQPVPDERDRYAPGSKNAP